VAVGEGSGAQGADCPAGIGVASQDHACGGLQGADAAHHFETIGTVTALPRQHHFKGGGTEEFLGLGSAKSVVDGAILALEDAPEDLMDGTVGIDYK
jgi:hypothetical protein